MRSIPSVITEALQSRAQTPYFSAVLKDQFDRPDPSQEAITSSNSGRSALLRLQGAPEAHYVRAYVNQPGPGMAAQVYSQLVTSPLTNAGWSLYDLRSSVAQSQAGVALAQFGATIWIFYQRLSDNAICCQTSSDGAGWSSETVLVNPGHPCFALASSGNGDLFAAIDDGSGAGVQNVIPYSYSAGVWTAGPMWTLNATKITALSAVYASSTYQLVAGAVTRPGGATCLCSTSYAGAEWSSLTPIHPLDDAGQGLACPYPGVTIIEGIYRVAATHYDSGVASGQPGQYTELWSSPDFIHWHLEQHLATAFVNGANIVAGIEGGFTVADAGSVIHSQSSTGNRAADIDISDDVMAIDIDEPTSQTTTASIVIANQAGQWTGGSPSLRIGLQCDVSLGYFPATVLTHRLYIDRIETSHAGDDEPIETVTLRLSNHARMLDHKVHIEKSHTGANLLYLVTETATAAGVNQPASPGTPQFAQTVDFFSQYFDKSWTSHLCRLAALYGFEWFVDENDRLQVREPSLTDPVAFTYGGGGSAPSAMENDIHEVRRANHVMVYGMTSTGNPAPFSLASDPANIQQVGEVAPTIVADRLLDNAAACHIRASLELRKAQRAGYAGTVKLPLNPAHQVMDIISVMDDGIGEFRINRLRWVVNLESGDFYQTATVEAP